MKLLKFEGPFEVAQGVKYHEDGSPFLLIRSKETKRWREFPLSPEQLAKLVESGEIEL